MLGQLIDVTVTSLGGLGDGISSHNGKPLFIPKSSVGDQLRVRIVHQNHDGYQGAIEEIITPGPQRVPAPCIYYTDCGGCKLQHMSQDDYRAFKTRMLHSALKSAGLSPDNAQMIFVPPGARRRVEFTLDHSGATIGLAFNKLRTNTLVAVDNCIVLEPGLQALMEPLCRALTALPEARNIKSLSLTQADSGVDMVLIAQATVAPDALEPLQNLSGISRIFLQGPDGKLHLVAQHSPVTMRLGPYDIDLPPDAFLQATKAGQDALTAIALEATQHAASVLDLFCGIGSYAFPLAARARVHAVEGDARMTAAMHSGIKTHGLTGMTAQQRDLFKQPLAGAELKRFDAAIINPPRIGAKAQTQALADSAINTIIMISCNPATFARDAAILKNAGFALTRATGVDQFVYSPFLEIAAIFNR